MSIIGFWKAKDAYGEFCNWYHAEFDLEGKHFRSSEQAFMYKKAELFNDQEHMAKILASKSAMMCKEMGRAVKPFDPSVFDQHKYQFMVDVCYAKFSQNSDLKKILLGTGDAILCEATPKDKIWGIGLEKTDPRFNDPSKWLGQNLLGKALMEVREKLK